MLRGSYVPKEIHSTITGENRTRLSSAPAVNKRSSINTSSPSRRSVQPDRTTSDSISTSSEKLHLTIPEPISSDHTIKLGYSSPRFPDSPKNQMVHRMIDLTQGMSNAEKTAILDEALKTIHGSTHEHKSTYEEQLNRNQDSEKKKLEAAKAQVTSHSLLVSQEHSVDTYLHQPDHVLHVAIPGSRISFDPAKYGVNTREKEHIRSIAKQYIESRDNKSLFNNMQDSLRLAHAMPENLGKPFAKCMISQLITWRNDRSGHVKGESTSEMHMTEDERKEYEAAATLLMHYCNDHSLTEYANGILSSLLSIKFTYPDDLTKQFMLSAQIGRANRLNPTLMHLHRSHKDP